VTNTIARHKSASGKLHRSTINTDVVIGGRPHVAFFWSVCNWPQLRDGWVLRPEASSQHVLSPTRR